MLSDLQKRFSGNKNVSFSEDNTGFIKATLKSDSGQELDVYLYGATVTSWRIAPERDVLFLSSKVEFKKGKAIRGGIPLVFPQFGGGVLPSHGFARTREWELLELSSDSQGMVNARLELVVDSSVNPDRKDPNWKYPLHLRYDIAFGSNLKTVLQVTNTGSESFSFQEALHTYFRVSDIAQVRIPGLGGLTYLDNLKGREKSTETRDHIEITEEIDRVYVNAPSKIEILESEPGRKISIGSQSLNDAVVWNPWIEKSKTLSDLGADDYRRFVCVETGNIATPITLAAKQMHRVVQEISYV